MNLVFGDCVEFITERHTIQKAFVIGEAAHSTDDRQIVVVADKDLIGTVVEASRCLITAAGFHALATDYRRRYLSLYPNDLRGLRVVDTSKQTMVAQMIKDWFYPSGGDRYNECEVLAEDILKTLTS